MINAILSFDKLIGSALVKFIYYVGLIGIVIAMLGVIGAGFASGEAVMMLGGIIAAPIVGAIYLLFWRFLCEMWLLMFKISNDLSEVKRILGGQAGQPPSA